MKKNIITVLAVAFICACAANTKSGITMIPKDDLNAMTPVQVAAYYKKVNAKKLEELIYLNGAAHYDELSAAYNGMNNELDALTKQTMTRSEYNEKVKVIVKKYQTRIDDICSGRAGYL